MLDTMHCNANGCRMGIAIAAVLSACIRSATSTQGEDVVQQQGKHVCSDDVGAAAAVQAWV